MSIAADRDAKPRPGRLRGRQAALLGWSALAFLLGLASGRWVDRLSSRAAAQEAEGPQHPPLIQEGDRIIVPAASPLRRELVVAPVGVAEDAHPLVLPASVEADPARTVNVLPPITGKIVELRVRLGDHVVKGQPLAVIDSGDLAQAYADDDKAREELKRAQRVLDRTRGLNQTGAGAVKDLEQAQTDYQEARAELLRAEARLQEIGAVAGSGGPSRLLTLVAPTTGSVTALACSPGSFVNDSTAPLMTIANLDRVWVTANVPESDVAYVTKGEVVDVTFPAYPGETLRGQVAFVSDVIEPDTRRCKTRIAFENRAGKLKPNMFATASFSVPQTSAVSVPNSALLMNNDRTVVFVEVEPWTFVRRTVVPAYGEGDGARIPQGLRPGDRIIVRGGVLLND